MKFAGKVTNLTVNGQKYEVIDESFFIQSKTRKPKQITFRPELFPSGKMARVNEHSLSANQIILRLAALRLQAFTIGDLITGQLPGRTQMRGLLNDDFVDIGQPHFDVNSKSFIMNWC